MANEIQFSFRTGATCYFETRNQTSGFIWNTASGAFMGYVSGTPNANIIVSTVEQGATGLYAGNFPSAIGPGVYSIRARQQLGGSAADSDPTVAVGDFQWNGTAPAPLSDTATSGQIGQIGPMRIARGTMVKPFPIYLKSSADHVTPFTSGVVSGQISKDGAAFTALQSGAFTEIGLGAYSCQALTSGDTSCNAAVLVFNAAGISGGSSDPLVMSFLTQKVSGF